MAGDRAQAEFGPEEHHSAAGTLIDTTMPHSARMWNYWLGGKDNFAADRAVGDQFSAIYPGIVDIAQADRAFLGRVIRYLAGEAGYASSWTSVPGCRRPTTPIRSRRPSRRSAGWCMSIMTRWC